MAPRSRAPTTQGLGVAPPPRSSEVSVAIPLPRGPGEPAAPAPRRPPSIPPRRANPLPAPGPLPGVIVGPGGAPPVPPAPPIIDENAFFDDATTAEPRAARLPVADDLSAPTTPFQIGQELDPVKVRALAHEDWSAPAPQPNGGPPRPSAAHDRAHASTQPDLDAGSVPGASSSRDEVDSPQNQHTASIPPLTPTPGMARSADAEDDLLEPRFSQAASPRRSGAARWIVASVFAGMAVLAFATVGRKLLVPEGAAKTGQADARIGALLADGEKSLIDGDLELAKEQFDKASILVEHDPRTAADLARLAAAKADVDWLRARLLPPDDPEQATARRELEQAVQRVEKAADRASAVAPADPAVIRSHVDALRLAGDLAGARRLVVGISAASAQPDNALTLAELDLAEAKPDWATVLGRLRTALTTDGNLGRARSMLVYALARSGDVVAARAELDHLGALARPHPLVGALRSFVARSATTVDPNALPDASARAPAGKPAPSGLPSSPAAPIAPATHEPREPREIREPHERPAPVEPRAPSPPPEEPAAPAGPIDTSDLPGVKAPSVPSPTPTPSPPSPPSPTVPRTTATPAPPPTPAVPPGVDTSDLPGFK